MPDLEQRLYELGDAIAWPEPRAFEVRVPAGVPHGRGQTWFRSRWLLGAAATIVIAAIALAAYPPTRTAIAGWLNLHTTILRVPQTQTPSPFPSGPLGDRLSLGDPSTLDKARSRVAWTVSVPSSLGAPDAVYVQKPELSPADGEISLVYGSRPGIPRASATGVSVLVTEARGRVDQVYFEKMLGAGATIEQVAVAGKPAYWITGSHNFVFVDANGDARFETLRIATNTLVLDRGGTIVRIEGDLTRDQAIAIASSLA